MQQANIFEILAPTFTITKKIRLIELFAGIGSQGMSIRDLGIDFEHYKVVEFDKYAIKSYNAIHDTNFEASDIKAIHASDLCVLDDDYTYIMTYSFPCQDLSKAGKQKGMEKGSNTRSGLLWEVERILDEMRGGQLPQVLLMENVPDVIGTKNIKHFQGWRLKLEQLGYSNFVECLNSKNYGIPQNRNRCFMISILGDYYYEFPKQIPLELRLKDMLQKEVDEKYYLSDDQVKAFKKSGYNTTASRLQEKEYADTLTARDYKDPKCVMVEGSLNLGNNDSNNRVYSSKGISPTLDTMQGGNRHPKIIDPVICASRGRNPLNPKSRKSREHVEQVIEINHSGCNNTLTTVQKDNLVFEVGGVAIPEATAKGYAIANDGDYVDLAYPDSKTRRGRVGKQCAQTLLCNDNNGVVVADGVYTGDSQKFHCNPLENMSRTIKANKHDAGVVENDARIRKLTPLECWRLMGFTDKDFYKAQAVNSNSQLYKQAGNSIVKQVLMAIFAQMIPDDYDFKKNN